MLIDDFPHKHFAPYIRMESIDGKFGIHNRVGGVVEVWFKVDEMGLAAYPVVYLLEFCRPALVRGGMKGKLDISRIDGHQGEEDWADIIGFTFLPNSVQIVDNDFRLEIRCPQAVGAGEDQEIFGPERQNILLKALQGHGGGIAAAP